MHSLNLPHWMWDVGVVIMPYSCSGFIPAGCPNGFLEEMETILKKLKLNQNLSSISIIYTENHSLDKVVTV